MTQCLRCGNNTIYNQLMCIDCNMEKYSSSSFCIRCKQPIIPIRTIGLVTYVAPDVCPECRMQSSNVRVMIQGKKGRGKDTLADFLTVELGHPTFVTGFAGELKDRFKRMVESFAYHNISTDKQHEVFELLSNREFMGPAWQWFGEFGRRIDKDIWIRLLEDNLENFRNDNIIVTDCRHFNEAEWGIANDFLLVKIVGPDHRQNDKRDEAHESERFVDDLPCDIVINNSSHINILEQAANRIISAWRSNVKV